MQLQHDTLHSDLLERKTEISRLTTQQSEDATERNQLRSSVDVLLGIKATSDQHLAALESQLASVRAQRDEETALRAKDSMDAAAFAQSLTQQSAEKLAEATAVHMTALATKDSRIMELENLLLEAKKDSIEAKKDSIALTEHKTALATKDSRIVQLEEQLSVAAIQRVDEVTAATTAAQHEASLALSLALATAKQEADTVIAQLQQDMSVLQGCVDERNSALVTAHQEADLCILQMDDQLRLAKADLVALLQQQQEQHQQQEEQQQEQEQLLVNELKHRIQTQSEEHVEQLRRVRDMVCSEREEQRVVQEHNDEDKERYAMYAEDLYRSLSREMEAHRLVREDTKVGIWRLHIHPHPHPLSSD